MTPQTFDAPDLVTIVVLGVLEGLLSADNALVLAIMVRHLPNATLQRRALTIGLAMSFIFRVVAIALVAWLIGLWWLQAIGGIYLLWLPIKHFRANAAGGEIGKSRGGTFLQTVIALGIADVAFAIDSVMAAVAFVGEPNKMWIVVIAAMIGVVMLRFAATYFITLLDKYPLLVHLAYVLIGWVGIKLSMMAGHTFVIWYNASNPESPLGFVVPEMSQTVFWVVLAIIVIGGGSLAMSRAKVQEADAAEEDADSPQEDETEADGR